MRTNIPEGVEIPSEEESTEVGELTNGRELVDEPTLPGEEDYGNNDSSM